MMMMSYVMMLCVILLGVILPLALPCRFPAFVQTNGTLRDWKSHIKRQYEEVSLRIQFNDDKMLATATDSYASSYTRVCIQVYNSNQYLVAHEESGQRQGRYTCMEFVARGAGILQIREAQLSGRMSRNLCNKDAFIFNDWIILDVNEAFYNQEPCTLQGGFNINVFDQNMQRAFCDAYKGETRLESECSAEHGITFYFRKHSCVPDGLMMYSQQRVVCMANWQEKEFNFSLLKHDRGNYMWMLRYPSAAKDRFSIYVLKDLIAPTSNQITTTNNYMHITMAMDLDQQGALCRDDYEICSVLENPCMVSTDMKLTCSKKCDLCNGSFPFVCEFEENFQGLWADSAHPDHGALSINASTIDFMEGSNPMRCISFGGETTKKNGANKSGLREIMLVSEMGNGCRPRYTCARISQISKQIMFFQLSHPQAWPLVEDPAVPVSCDNFEYGKEDGAPTITTAHSRSNKYISKHMWLLVSLKNTSSVPCNLSGFSSSGNVEVEFLDGIRCTAVITQPNSLHTFSFTFADCTSTSSIVTDTYSCIEYERHPPSNDLFLVTKSSGNPMEINCWIFPKRPDNLFMMLPANQCNEKSKKRIRKGRLNPIATFTKPKRRLVVLPNSVIKSPNTTTMLMSETQNEEAVLRPSVSIVNATYNITHTTTTTTPSTKDESLTTLAINVTFGEEVDRSSPMGVIALVATILGTATAFVIACKCS